MRRANTNLKLQPKKQADLQVVKQPEVKTTKYSDINLKKWKDYAHILTGTLWQFPSRLKQHGHSNEYHGNYIPQIAQQMYERYTKKGDVVLDLFFGSGTSGIEAINMERRCIGVELKEDLAESVSEKFTPKQLVTDVRIICGDSSSEVVKDKIQAGLDILGEKKAQFLMLHPPYACLSLAMCRISSSSESLFMASTVNLFIIHPFFLFRHIYLLNYAQHKVAQFIVARRVAALLGMVKQGL